MWPLALCVFAFTLSQLSAIPVLPLAQSGIERLDEFKGVGVGSNGPRTFIVQVQQQQPLPTQQQQQTREFPWPYVSFSIDLYFYLFLCILAAGV